jgi:outer membrane protein W
MRSRKLPLVLSALLVLAALPAAAESEARFKLFAGAVWSTPLDDSQARLGSEIETVELGDDIGWEAGFAWRFTRAIGVEASLSRTGHQVNFGSARLGEAELEAAYISLNFYLFRGERWEWWVAPTVAFFEWRDDGFGRGVQVDEDGEDGFGGTVGFDYGLAEHWTLTAAVRYVDIQLAFGGGGEVAVDPLSVRAGVGFRF